MVAVVLRIVSADGKVTAHALWLRHRSIAASGDACFSVRALAAQATVNPCIGFFQTATLGDTGLQNDSETSEPSATFAVPVTTGLTRVLVVDDDPMVCMAIDVYLQRQGFKVTIADDGESGLRAIQDATFDLMIVDIFMPHMRGFESIRIFHERAPAIPLIAMSGYAFASHDAPVPDFLRMALELGASRCLRKPFTPAALLAVINDCVRATKSVVASVTSSSNAAQGSVPAAPAP